MHCSNLANDELHGRIGTQHYKLVFLHYIAMPKNLASLQKSSDVVIDDYERKKNLLLFRDQQ